MYRITYQATTPRNAGCSVGYDAESSSHEFPLLAGPGWMAPATFPTISAADFGGSDDQSRLLRGGKILGWLRFHEHHKNLGLGYSLEEIERLRAQDVGEGEVNIRLYEGRVVQGPLKGTEALFKVYPGSRSGASEADLMAVNELRTHVFLQNDASDICENIQFLLGAFETATGEQWLAFRDDGRYSAADYAKLTSERKLKEQSRSISFWNPYDRAYKLELKRYFVLKLLNGAMCGLVCMHNHDRLHQSLGPSSVVLKYGAGLLLAYMSFIPFCEAGTMDGISLQRLLENTFRLDIYAAREYFLADDRLSEAVDFLDLGDGAGWELLQAMLNPDYRKRPIAEAVLNHRFLTGAVLWN
uniref:Protein kinase domain-containing protein n=1 Tax=Oryza punctata TaxID=4537 RepID=A0A0E0K3W1_ORYPU